MVLRGRGELLTERARAPRSAAPRNCRQWRSMIAAATWPGNSSWTESLPIGSSTRETPSIALRASISAFERGGSGRHRSPELGRAQALAPAARNSARRWRTGRARRSRTGPRRAGRRGCVGHGEAFRRSRSAVSQSRFRVDVPAARHAPDHRPVDVQSVQERADHGHIHQAADRGEPRAGGALDHGRQRAAPGRCDQDEPAGAPGVAAPTGRST